MGFFLVVAIGDDSLVGVHGFLTEGVSLLVEQELWGTRASVVGARMLIVGKEPACQCGRCKRAGFNPWVGKIPWRRKWQPTPVFLLGESPWTEEPGGLQSTGLQRVGHD